MRPAQGEVLHFSEDPTIALFEPHVAATAAQREAYVWAVGHDRAPDYWFPRQCPRALVWATANTTEADRERLIDAGGGTRVHVIEYAWWRAMCTTRLYAYRLPAAQFHPIGDPPHAVVATEPVTPLGPAEPVGDLIDCHARAGIPMRLVDNLWPYWDRVIESTAGFSGIRLRNARPRLAEHST
ncbi:MAG: DUF6886 family protein [Actinoplanes sp.]